MMDKSEYKLTDVDRARIERNRQHALLRRQARMANHPYLNKESECVTRFEDSKLVDTGGGFFIEESQLNAEKKESTKVKLHPVPTIPSKQLHCKECQKVFNESYLQSHFDLETCDECKDDEDKHSLITKTEAKNEFLLKDVDIDKREPLLRFIVRKNPHNPRWGNMKLYLRSQIYERALEVWGSEEQIEEEKEKRMENKEKQNQKKFNKKVKELRMAVRSSTFTKDLTGHKHSFGPEEYDEVTDMYHQTCTSCKQTISFEKM